MRPSLLVQASALLVVLLFFLLLDEFGYIFCAFEANHCGNAVSYDSRIWIQLLCAFNRDRGSSQLFEYSHDFLLLSVRRPDFGLGSPDRFVESNGAVKGIARPEQNFRWKKPNMD